ncbi:MAG: hypothetical protein ACTSQY_08840 [Candidatus Odinarchaeia archaeon]
MKVTDSQIERLIKELEWCWYDIGEVNIHGLERGQAKEVIRKWLKKVIKDGDQKEEKT